MFKPVDSNFVGFRMLATKGANKQILLADYYKSGKFSLPLRIVFPLHNGKVLPMVQYNTLEDIPLQTVYYHEFKAVEWINGT